MSAIAKPTAREYKAMQRRKQEARERFWEMTAEADWRSGDAESGGL
jgi:hypothetical protein